MRTETPEEVERRLAYAKKAQERHEQWIREQFAKLDADVEKRLEEKRRERDA